MVDRRGKGRSDSFYFTVSHTHISYCRASLTQPHSLAVCRDTRDTHTLIPLSFNLYTCYFTALKAVYTQRALKRGRVESTLVRSLCWSHIKGW